MRNPIENLGDYNIARETLKTFGGSWNALYKNIGNTAVAKATPKLMLKGGFVGAGILAVIGGVSYGTYRGYCFIKNRKKLIENEPALKKEFSETIEAELSKMSDNFPTASDKDYVKGDFFDE